MNGAHVADIKPSGYSLVLQLNQSARRPLHLEIGQLRPLPSAFSMDCHTLIPQSATAPSGTSSSSHTASDASRISDNGTSSSRARCGKVAASNSYNGGMSLLTHPTASPFPLTPEIPQSTKPRVQHHPSFKFIPRRNVALHSNVPTPPLPANPNRTFPNTSGTPPPPTESLQSSQNKLPTTTSQMNSRDPAPTPFHTASTPPQTAAPGSTPPSAVLIADTFGAVNSANEIAAIASSNRPRKFEAAPSAHRAGPTPRSVASARLPLPNPSRETSPSPGAPPRSPPIAAFALN